MTTHEHLPSPEYPFPETVTPSQAGQTPTPPDKPWQSMYQAERKKARVLGATTVAASLLAVGLGAWGLNAQGSSTTAGPGQFGGPGATSQFGPPGSTGQGSTGTLPGQGNTGTMPGTGQGGPMGQDLGSLLLNADGSVNTEALQQFLARMPTGALDQILSFAVQNGEITQAQADEIAKAAASNGSSTSGTSTGQDT